MSIKEQALVYAGLGWQLVQLKGPKSKAPWMTDWPSTATDDLDVIDDWWTKHPDWNVGVKLGRDSGIIDVEIDSPKALETFLELFEGEYPPTPTYESKRGSHCFFKYSLHLPFPNKPWFHVNELEFRTGNGDKASQSVLPPSTHPDGYSYTWRIHPEHCELMEIPQSVMVRLLAMIDGQAPGGGSTGPVGRSKSEWEIIRSGTSEGGRNDSIASVAGALVAGISDLDNSRFLDAAFDSVLAVNERHSPPLPFEEVKATFESVVRAESGKRSALNNSEIFRTPAVDVIAAEPTRDLQELKLVRIESDPVCYEFHSPAFVKSDGFIELSSAQLCSGPQVRIAAVEQAGYAFKSEFLKEWKTGLLEELIAVQEIREPEPEETTRSAIASLFADASKIVVSNRDSVRPTGFYKHECTLLFKFTYALAMFADSPYKINRRELSRWLKANGVEEVLIGEKRSRYRKINSKTLGKIERGEM